MNGITRPGFHTSLRCQPPAGTMAAMDEKKLTPAPTLRQILRFRCIECSADVHRRFQAKYKAQRAAGKGARVRGIDVHYIEPEIVELAAAN